VGLAQAAYNALDLGKPGTVYASGAHRLR